MAQSAPLRNMGIWMCKHALKTQCGQGIVVLDVGGSMDPYIKLVEELFSAARTEFKHLEYFTFTTACTKGVARQSPPLGSTNPNA